MGAENFLFIVFISLAVFRATKLVVDDKVFDWPRNKLFDLIPHVEPLVSCYWCIGFWLSGLTVLIVKQFYGLGYPFLSWFAVSSLVGLLSVFVEDVDNF